MRAEDVQIDPELRRTGKLMRTLVPSFSERTLRTAAATMRAADRLRMWPGKSPRPQRISVPRQDGTGLALSVFAPLEQATARSPVVLWIHGGGFALDAPLQDFGLIDLLVSLGCTVVSPHYRLSTEKPFPASFDDCYRSLEWAYDHLCKPQGRTLAIGGESAGGSLCAAVCMKARDESGPPVASHMPLYPMLDDRMITASSQGNRSPVWNSASNEVAWHLYLGELFGTDDVPPYAAPARATSFAGMPAGCTYIGDVDPFLDETKAYVKRLRECGVSMALMVLPGCFHGFDLLCPRSTPARAARAFLKERFLSAMERAGDRGPTE